MLAALPAVCLAWGLLAGVRFFGIWLFSHLSVLAWVVQGLAWVIAVAATALGVVALSLRRRAAWAGAAAVLGVLGGTTVIEVDWDHAFVRGFYQLNRDDFAAVARLSREHKLGDDGGRLPAGLRHLALNGDPLTAGATAPDSTAVWLPAWTGLVDGVTGYAYIGGPAAGTIVDCLGDPCRVRWSLGEGWSWVEMGA